MCLFIKGDCGTSTSTKHKGQFIETNVEKLKSYDTVKVMSVHRIILINIVKIGELLGLMRLQQYAASFSDKSVDGKKLLELNDLMLEEDLGIKNMLHRLRIMRIIRGHQCVTDFINNPR